MFHPAFMLREQPEKTLRGFTPLAHDNKLKGDHAQPPIVVFAQRGILSKSDFA
jgi:hypothetical protein